MPHKLVHLPIRKPRRGHIGEAVFFEHWRLLMATGVPDGLFDQRPRTMLQEVLGSYPWKIDQRCASVCATFVTWLGCNCGSSIIHQARLYMKMGLGDRSFCHSWLDTNQRLSATNGGFRTIEAMLAPDDHFGRRMNHPPGFDGLLWIPYLRQEDHEAVEHLCTWLGSGAGWRFIVAAELEIQRRQAAEHVRMSVAHRGDEAMRQNQYLRLGYP